MDEVNFYLDEAEKRIEASKILLSEGYYKDAISRARDNFESMHKGCPGIYVVPFGQYSLWWKGYFMLLYNF